MFTFSGHVLEASGDRERERYQSICPCGAYIEISEVMSLAFEWICIPMLMANGVLQCRSYDH